MVENRLFPILRGVAGVAVPAKPPGVGILLLMAAGAILGSLAQVGNGPGAGVALSAAGSGVGAYQPKCQPVMVKATSISIDPIMAGGAFCAEVGCMSRHISRFKDFMAVQAGGWIQAGDALGVAVGAGESFPILMGAVSGERKAQFFVGKIRQLHPGQRSLRAKVICVAGSAGRALALGQHHPVEILPVPQNFCVAFQAVAGQPLRLPKSRMAGRTAPLQLGVRPDASPAVRPRLSVQFTRAEQRSPAGRADRKDGEQRQQGGQQAADR
jgi:hypothetical protein